MIDKIVLIIPVIPVLRMADLLLDDNGADDQRDSESKLDHHQYLARCDQCIHRLERPLEDFHRLKRGKKECRVTARQEPGEYDEGQSCEPEINTAILDM